MKRAVPVLLLAVVVAACGGSVTTQGPAGPTAPPPNIPAASTAAPAVTPGATPSRTPDLQGILDQRRKAYGAPGLLALVRLAGERRFVASGVAELGGTPITADTRFRVASITKTIVAALVLDAAARGEVSLDDTVEELLPGVLRPGPPVTVRMLLDHTSGIFNELGEGDPAAEVERLTDPALRDEARAIVARGAAGEQVVAPAELVVALAETHDRYSEPGTGWHYSNVAYIVAGMVLEKVTGRPVADLLRERIAEPLGLERTSIAPPDMSSPGLRGYDSLPPYTEIVDVTDAPAFVGTGAHGGVVTTADELLAILSAIVGGRLLSEELTAEMREPTELSLAGQYGGLSSHGSGGGYGLGLAVYRLSCGVFYGHPGELNGTRSLALVCTDGTDGIVLAANLVRDRDDAGLEMIAEVMLCAGR